MFDGPLGSSFNDVVSRCRYLVPGEGLVGDDVAGGSGGLLLAGELG